MKMILTVFLVLGMFVKGQEASEQKLRVENEGLKAGQKLLKAENESLRTKLAKRDQKIEALKKELAELHAQFDAVKPVEKAVPVNPARVQVLVEQVDGDNSLVVITQGKPYGRIYLEGLGANVVDGNWWSGEITPDGTYTYTTVTGASAKVLRYKVVPSVKGAKP